MPGKSNCPDFDTLQRLQQGLIPEPEAAELRRHQAGCITCTKTVQMLASEMEANVPAAKAAGAKRPGKQALHKEGGFPPACKWRRRRWWAKFLRAR